MKVTNRITVHLDDPRLVPPIDVMQGDAYTRELELTLYSGGVAWPVPDGVSVAAAYHGASGKGIYNTLPDGSAAYSVSENVVTVTLIPQALAVPGHTEVTVVFTDGNGKQLATFCVTLKVAANPAVGAVKPSDYINLRQWMSAELATLIDEIPASAFHVDVFPAGEGYATEETMGEIQDAYESGRTVYCDLETEDQELLTLPMVKVEGGVCYFAAVCDGVEWLVTITRDGEDNTVVDVTQRELGATAFWVTVTQDGGVFAADKTFAEIAEAHAAGQAVYCLLGNEYVLPLVAASDTSVVFQEALNREYQKVVITAEDAITYNSGKYALLEEASDVYVGTEEPTDPNVLLWIDPEGEDDPEEEEPDDAETGYYIPTPETAEVGQTIVVKSVDENGKPTEWKTVNVSQDYEYITEFTIEGADVISYELVLGTAYKEVLITTLTNISAGSSYGDYPGSSTKITTSGGLEFIPMHDDTALHSSTEQGASGKIGHTFTTDCSANRQYVFILKDRATFTEFCAHQTLISGGVNAASACMSRLRKSLVSGNALMNKIMIDTTSSSKYFADGVTLYVYGVRA